MDGRQLNNAIGLFEENLKALVKNFDQIKESIDYAQKYVGSWEMFINSLRNPEQINTMHSVVPQTEDVEHPQKKQKVVPDSEDDSDISEDEIDLINGSHEIKDLKGLFELVGKYIDEFPIEKSVTAYFTTGKKSTYVCKKIEEGFTVAHAYSKKGQVVYGILLITANKMTLENTNPVTLDHVGDITEIAKFFHIKKFNTCMFMFWLTFAR